MPDTGSLNDVPDSVIAALKEMLLLVYSLRIYPTDFEIWRNSEGDYGFTLKRDPAFEAELCRAPKTP